MQAADLEKDLNSFTVCVAIGMFVLGLWGITLPSFFSPGTGLLAPSGFMSSDGIRLSHTDKDGNEVHSVNA